MQTFEDLVMGAVSAATGGTWDLISERGRKVWATDGPRGAHLILEVEDDPDLPLAVAVFYPGEPSGQMFFYNCPLEVAAAACVMAALGGDGPRRSLRLVGAEIVSDGEAEAVSYPTVHTQPIPSA